MRTNKFNHTTQFHHQITIKHKHAKISKPIHAYR